MSNDVISCSGASGASSTSPPFISLVASVLPCEKSYYPLLYLCTVSHTYNHTTTTIIRTMTQIIITINAVQLPPYPCIPYYHCNVQVSTQPPLLFTTYKYQSTPCYCLQTDRRSDPTQLICSSAQPGYRATDKISAVLFLDFLGFVSNLGAQKGNTLLRGVTHEVAKGKMEMEAVDGVDTWLMPLTQCVQDQIRFQMRY